MNVTESVVHKPVAYEPHKKITKLMMKLEREHEKIDPKCTVKRRRIQKKWAGLATKLRRELGL